MRVVLVVGLLALGACSPAVREAQAAERRYDILAQAGGSAPEKCAARREVEAAWLKAEDADKWQRARVDAELTCNQVAIDNLRG